MLIIQRKILLRLDCNCCEQKFCSTYTGFSRTQRALDDDTENAHSSINRSSHSNFLVAQFQNISSYWPMNFLWFFFMRIVEFCYEFIAALTLILTFWRSANLLNVPLASKVMNWKTERHRHRHRKKYKREKYKRDLNVVSLNIALLWSECIFFFNAIASVLGSFSEIKEIMAISKNLLFKDVVAATNTDLNASSSSML